MSSRTPDKIRLEFLICNDGYVLKDSNLEEITPKELLLFQTCASLIKIREQNYFRADFRPEQFRGGNPFADISGIDDDGRAYRVVTYIKSKNTSNNY